MKPAERLFSIVMRIPSEGPAGAKPIILDWISSVGASDGETSNPTTQTVSGERFIAVRGSTSSFLASSSSIDRRMPTSPVYWDTPNSGTSGRRFPSKETSGGYLPKGRSVPTADGPPNPSLAQR
ncbi:hypothetical protein ACLOJK_027595 [Asimina triloba]